MQKHERALLGSARSANGRFPLLVKILDAEQKLSLQVHPPASKAAALHGEPKTELWYITAAKPGAELFVGLKPGATREVFEARIRDGTVADCFHRIPVRAGDAMVLPSGRVHAIGAGLVIFEIQQNSDTTYRVFDWNRTDATGKPRQLHVKESLECIDFQDIAPKPIGAAEFSNRVQTLVDDPLFAIEIRRLPANAALNEPLSTAAVIAVVEGAIQIDAPDQGVNLAPGGFCLVPASMAALRGTASQPTSLLVARPR
jgi:mannose-6-phosphate isomerase